MAEADTQTAWRRTLRELAGGLGYAASPGFALMAIAAAVQAPVLTLCTSPLPLGPVSDMAVMYLLMSLVHLPHWLRLLARPWPARQQAHAPIQTLGD